MTWPEAFATAVTLVAFLVFTYFLLTGPLSDAARRQAERRQEERLDILGLVKFNQTPEWKSTTTYRDPDASEPEKSESEGEKKL